MTLCSGRGAFCDTGLRGREEGEEMGGRGVEERKRRGEGEGRGGKCIYTHEEEEDIDIRTCK